MQNKNAIGIMIGFFIFAGAFIFIASRREYRIEGNQVYVKTPQAATTLQKTGEFSQQVYLLAGEGLNANDYYQAELPAIPMGTVEELTKKYGDFRKCASAGTKEGKQSILNLRLIGENDNAKQKIVEAYKKSRSGKSEFLLRIEGANLDIVKHEIKSNRARNLMQGNPANFLVRELELVEISK